MTITVGKKNRDRMSMARSDYNDLLKALDQLHTIVFKSSDPGEHDEEMRFATEVLQKERRLKEARDENT